MDITVEMHPPVPAAPKSITLTLNPWELDDLYKLATVGRKTIQMGGAVDLPTTRKGSSTVNSAWVHQQLEQAMEKAGLLL